MVSFDFLRFAELDCKVLRWSNKILLVNVIHIVTRIIIHVIHISIYENLLFHCRVKRLWNILEILIEFVINKVRTS